MWSRAVGAADAGTCRRFSSPAGSRAAERGGDPAGARQTRSEPLPRPVTMRNCPGRGAADAACDGRGGEERTQAAALQVRLAWKGRLGAKAFTVHPAFPRLRRPASQRSRCVGRWEGREGSAPSASSPSPPSLQAELKQAQADVIALRAPPQPFLVAVPAVPAAGAGAGSQGAGPPPHVHSAACNHAPGARGGGIKGFQGWRRGRALKAAPRRAPLQALRVARRGPPLPVPPPARLLRRRRWSREGRGEGCAAGLGAREHAYPVCAALLWAHARTHGWAAARTVGRLPGDARGPWSERDALPRRCCCLAPPAGVRHSVSVHRGGASRCVRSLRLLALGDVTRHDRAAADDAECGLAGGF